MKNIGWLYLRDYFGPATFFEIENIDQNDQFSDKQKGEKIEELFVGKNKTIFDQPLEVADILKAGSMPPILLQTTYPGLIVGTGTAHEIGQTGELKLGFSFDHTTGQPVIPGSSVKGVLRSTFPNRLRHQNTRKQNPDEGLALKADQKEAYLRELIGEVTGLTLTDDELLHLEWAVFEGVAVQDIPRKSDGQPIFTKMTGQRLSVYQADIFYDAYICEAKHPFLGNDYLTPHRHKDRSKRDLDALVNPTPLQFMKILPGVTFAFQFDLKPTPLGDRIFSPQHKRDLILRILLDFGIGAKTNVGYGNLLEVLTEEEQQERETRAYEASRPKADDVREKYLTPAEQYKKEEGGWYLAGNLKKGMYLEAHCLKPDPRNAKMQIFQLLIAGRSKLPEISKTYSPNFIGKSCIIKVNTLTGNRKDVQSFDFKEELR